MLRQLTRAVLPGGSGGKLTTLIFHRVFENNEPMRPDDIDGDRFHQILGWLKTQFTILDPIDACQRISSRSLPSGAATITFDDGYRDNHDVAMPILKEHGLNGAFFIATGYTPGGSMFNDRVFYAIKDTRQEDLSLPWLEDGRQMLLTDARSRLNAVNRVIDCVKHLSPDLRTARVNELVQKTQSDAPDGLMLDESQVRNMAASGMVIGGHTRTHPILSRVADNVALDEIQGGRSDLKDILGRAPELFAYPNGKLGSDYQLRHCDMARQAGFSHAFSTEHGVSGPATDLFQLRRFTPWDRTALRFGFRLLVNGIATRS